MGKFKTPRACEHCGKEFMYWNHWNQHRLIHTDEKPHKCHICKTEFRQPGHLSTHMMVHADEDQKHKCQKCGEKFSQEGNLRRHCNSVHRSNLFFKCKHSGCVFKTSRKDKLKQHSWTHTPSPFQCETCDKRFTNRTDLKRHKTLHVDSD